MKPWQIGLVAVAALVLAGSLWTTVFGSKRVKVVDRIYLVDVVSGEVFYAPMGGQRALVLPAKNPETGRRTVVPLVHKEDGTVGISDRYVGLAEDILSSLSVNPSELIDPSTWVVRTELGDARAYEIP